MRRQECGSNAMVTVQMTVVEYLEMKSRQEIAASASVQQGDEKENLQSFE